MPRRRYVPEKEVAEDDRKVVGRCQWCGDHIYDDEVKPSETRPTVCLDCKKFFKE